MILSNWYQAANWIKFNETFVTNMYKGTLWLINNNIANSYGIIQWQLMSLFAIESMIYIFESNSRLKQQ